jgi:hypothetical protein
VIWNGPYTWSDVALGLILVISSTVLVIGLALRVWGKDSKGGDNG